MSGFSAAWLELREPQDRRARHAAVIEAVAKALSDHSSVSITDLACGTGSTLRVLSPRIKARQNWRLTDNDLSLLARTPQSSPPQLHVKTMPVDLNRDASVLMFVDLAMPLVSGFEVLSWLHANRPNQFFPIVLSGSRRDEDVRKAYGLGAEEYLTKPLTPLLLAALAARAAAALARH